MRRIPRGCWEYATSGHAASGHAASGHAAAAPLPISVIK
jgi:hypothetical protein